jgi:iron transport multicopper oxidase
VDTLYLLFAQIILGLGIRFFWVIANGWFFHCHIDWHVISGMAAQFIEAPLEMQKRIVVPDTFKAQCQQAGIQISGPST